MALVSIVMPIYNAEKYVSQAIDSVLNQTLSDFELILINDGSTDKSAEICASYARDDQRIKLIHQNNGGICSARNKGLTLARGEYIAFIDNDDVYLPDLLEENYILAKKYNADILKYGNQYIKQKIFSVDAIHSSGKLNEEALLVIRKNDLPAEYKKLNEADLLVYVWDGLFKTELIREKQITFDSQFKYGHEDRVFCMQLYPHSKCVVINPKIYYQHIVYKTSTSRVFSIDRIGDTERLLTYEQNLFDSLQLSKSYPAYWQQRVITYVILICSIMRKPEAKLSWQEVLQVLHTLRETYYLPAFFGFHKTEQSKRLKNKIYAWLFERNYLKILAYALLIDRKTKYMVQLLVK
ncbi:glycosyltransferase family 2 protein [Propionispira raffinosivorans]|uniref:glycosyltransferase family 2 protein n=1 Tax=Propionispira raffinosivorans TaxID=86959 RepID=UPI00037446FD|nr:glycosyltransferase [Propionispira raffinosivorans]